MMRSVLFSVVLAGCVLAAIGLIWVCVLVAGTGWSLLVAGPAVVVAFLADWLSERRPGLTSLERFERRQQRRAA